MGHEVERRTEGGARIPFEGLVEVGASSFPPFEAQAIDASSHGMHLRTAYLPEIGQAVSVRFDLGAESVLASGEVIWREELSTGGDFGVRFRDLDEESGELLQRFTQAARAPRGEDVAHATGARVQLHIDGMSAAMPARVRGAEGTRSTIVSKLGFLQLGKELSIEDFENGVSREAKVDRVELEIDPESKVPLLVIGLSYAGADGQAPALVDRPVEAAPRGKAKELASEAEGSAHAAAAEDDGDDEAAAESMKGGFARSAAKVTPAIVAFAKRARTTIELLAKKRGDRSTEALPEAVRRTTAKPPSGALHASGRKVVRDDDAGDAPVRLPLTGAAIVRAVDKRKLAIGGAVGVALILVAMAMRKPSSAHADVVATADSALSPPASAPAAIPAAAALPPVPPPASQPIAEAPIAATRHADVDDVDHPKAHKKKLHVTAFSNGAVGHANVLRLKMDSAIEKIQGASQPAGFSVNLPGVRSLEAAGPLAARDSRIASIKVTNEGSGAELTVTFKDGVPNYQVRAKGDVLEIALAPIGGAGRDDSDDETVSNDAPRSLKRVHAKSHDRRAKAGEPVKRHGKPKPVADEDDPNADAAEEN